MADIELVIKIDEHDKNVIKRFVQGDGCEDFPPSIIENLIRAVYFGTPIEKHDEEIIKETVESIWGKPPCDDAISRQAVLHKAYKYGLYGFMQDIEDTEQFPPVYPQVQSRRLKHALEIIDKYRGERNE